MKTIFEIFFKIRCFLVSVGRYILTHFSMEHRKNISGELCVSGCSSVTIELGRRETPTAVIVEFKEPKHHRHHHPCNHHHEKLSWELVHQHHGHPALKILWDIDGMSEILYSVIY